MRFSSPQTLKSLADLIGAEMIGPADHAVLGINEIHKVQAGDLVFVDYHKYYQKALDCEATTILINTRDVVVPEGKALLFSEDPFRDFNRITRHHRPVELKQSERADGAIVGVGTHISPGVHIGARVTIGRDCVIHPGVILQDDTHLGDRVIIHPNTVIGSDAFYYKARPEGREKLHTCGEVVIGDDVEIGALCTIVRGVTGDTRIGRHSKLDCQVHVGHDTVIGEHCLIAAQVGIAGCVRIEDHVTLWGQVGIGSDTTIHEGATLLGQSGPFGDVPAGRTYLGTPAQESRSALRDIAAVRKLADHLRKSDRDEKG